MNMFECTRLLQTYKCKKCFDFQTFCLTSLRQHFINDHKSQSKKEVLYKCSVCHYETFSKYLILRHELIDVCPSKIVQINVEYTGTKGVKKNEDATAMSIIPLLDHERVKYTSNFRRILHLNEQHSLAESEDIQWFKCNQCPVKTKWKKNLKRHIRTHHAKKIKWFKCDECPAKSEWKSSLERHIRTQHTKNVKWFKCNKCPIKSKWKLSLERHITTHHTKNIKWFKCDECPAKFKTKVGVKRHMQKHQTDPEKIKWFKCDECPARFKAKMSVKRHMQKHQTDPEKIKWFQCDECPAKFKWKNSLVRHIKIHHTDLEKISS